MKWLILGIMAVSFSTLASETQFTLSEGIAVPFSQDYRVEKILTGIKCTDGKSHSVARFEVQSDFEKETEGALYAGRGLQNEVLIIQEELDHDVYTLHFCPENYPDLNGKGLLLREAVKNMSINCDIAEVSAANILLESKGDDESYMLQFFPIDMQTRIDESLVEVCREFSFNYSQINSARVNSKETNTVDNSSQTKLSRIIIE
jgi:hypothetical protein